MRFKPRQFPSIRQLNQVAEMSRRAGAPAVAHGGPGVAIRATPAGVSYFDPNKRSFWAKLTDKSFDGGGSGCVTSGSGMVDTIWYSFTEVIDTGCGDWLDSLTGMSAELIAFEANNLDVPLVLENGPTVVYMRPAPGSEKYVFAFGGVGEGGSGSGGGCNSMAADFPVRAAANALGTDLLLTSDPVNNTTVNYTLGSLLDSQMNVTAGADRKWPGKIHVNSSYGDVIVDTYASPLTFNMGVTGSNLHIVTLAGNPTLFTVGTTPGQEFGLFFKQDGTGGRTITSWFSGIVWQSGSPPTLASAAGAVTFVKFIASVGGASFRDLDTKTWAS